MRSKISSVLVLLFLLAACAGESPDGGVASGEEGDTTEDEEASGDGATEDADAAPAEDIDYGDLTPDCDSPTEVNGFLTCADVEAAAQEGAVTVYGSVIEPALVALLEEFNEVFPEITGDYVRLQAGALYSRLLSEREAGNYSADVLVLTDMAMLQDFQDMGGFAQYVSPEIYAYPQGDHLSEPVGYFQNWGMISAGIAYNPNFVDPADAPQDWPDLLDPEWRGEISFKFPTSGAQFDQWRVLRDIYGPEFWQDMAEQEPAGFDSGVQQYDRLVSGDDLIAGNAHYSIYQDFKSRGAPIEFVVPPGGLVASIEAVGVVEEAPNPQAARLFLDWVLSEQGQDGIQRHFNHHSVREGMPPPTEYAVSVQDAEFIVPARLSSSELEELRAEFEAEFSGLVGMP